MAFVLVLHYSFWYSTKKAMLSPLTLYFCSTTCLSSLNKIDDKTYVVLKGNEVQFQDLEVLELSSYCRVIQGEFKFSA